MQYVSLGHLFPEELANVRALADEFTIKMPGLAFQNACKVGAQMAATVAEATMLACCVKNNGLSKPALKQKLSATWAQVKKHGEEFGSDLQSLIHPVIASAATERACG